MTQNDTEARLAELEIQVALQNDLLDSLNDTVARLQPSCACSTAACRKKMAAAPTKPLIPPPKSRRIIEGQACINQEAT